MSPDQMEGISVWASNPRRAIGVCERTMATSKIPNHTSRLRKSLKKFIIKSPKILFYYSIFKTRILEVTK